VQPVKRWPNRKKNFCSCLALLLDYMSGGGKDFCGKLRQSLQLVRYLRHLRYRGINKLCVFNLP
jgi:hypothetical protein